jgi:hypothetical protein
MTEEEKKANADEKARVASEKAAAKAEAKKAADDAKAAAKAAKEAAKPAKVAPVSQNGVTRPTRGVTLKVWEAADKISAEKKAPADRKEVVAACADDVPEVGTIHTQYGRWRKFHGLVAVRETKVKE